MDRLRLLAVALLSCLILFQLGTAETQEDSFQCPFVCTAENPLTYFGVLRSHEYEFEIKHRINSPINEHEAKGGYYIKGRAIISGGTYCTYFLQLEGVTANEIKPDGSEIEQEGTGAMLQERGLYFGYEDGQVTGFCPASKEDSFAWNIKASILSHLQVGVKSFVLPTESEEVDISGRCLTQFDVIGNSNKTVRFRKRKPTAGCVDKYSYITRFDGNADGKPTGHSKNWIVDGSQECEVEFVMKKTVSKASCKETIVIKGFDDRFWDRYNTIEVETRVEHISTTSAGTLEIDLSNEYLHLDLTHRANFAVNRLDKSTAKDKALAVLNAAQNEYTEFTNEHFRIIVDAMSQLSSDDDFEEFKAFNASSLTLNMLYDSAIYAQTETSLRFLDWCVLNARAKLPVAHISLLPDPSLSFITAVNDLNHIENTEKMAVVANLLLTFCRNHPGCSELLPVKTILESFETDLEHNCNADDPDYTERGIASLRAIGTIGFTSNSTKVYPVLETCMNRQSSPDTYVRATAAEALRKFDESARVDSMLWKVVTDEQEDVEVRIQAYRSWARQMSLEKAGTLEFVLSEPNEQVKSFIITHLYGVMSTVDRRKRDAVRELEGLPEDLKNRLKTYTANPLRTSVYKEKYMPVSQAAIKAEASVIYGPQSSLPRLLGLNFTIDVLGYSVNAMEIGYRSVDSEGLASRIKRWWRKTSDGKNEEIDEPNRDSTRKLDRRRSADAKSRVYIRMFGRELVHIDDADDADNIGQIFETRQAFYGLNETLILPTIGGLMVQYVQKLAVNQDVRYVADPRASGVFLEVDAHRLLMTTLNTPEGGIGYLTEDNYEVNTDIVITLDASSGVPELTDCEFGIFGMDNNTTMFKTLRKVSSISANGEMQEISTPPVTRVCMNSPRFLEPLLGLRAQVNVYHHLPSGLLMGYSVFAEKFEGLFVKYQYEKQNYSEAFQSTKFEVQRLKDRRSLSVSKDYIMRLSVLTRSLQKGQSSTVNVVVPWGRSYDLFLAYNEDGEFNGTADVGSWTGDIHGRYTPTSLGGAYNLTALASSSDGDLAINVHSTPGKSFIFNIDVNVSSLPFSLESTTAFVFLSQIEHSSILKLPTRHENVSLDVSANWTPHNHEGKLTLLLDGRTFSKSATVAYSAINRLNTWISLPVNKYTYYNYSIDSIVHETEDAESKVTSFGVGTSALLTQADSETWIIDAHSWIGRHKTNLSFGRQLNDKVENAEDQYVFDAEYSDHQSTKLRANGHVLTDFSNGGLNASLRNDKVCNGENKTGNFRLAFNSRPPKMEQTIDVFCGDTPVYSYQNLMDLTRKHQTIIVTYATEYRVAVESDFELFVKDSELDMKVNSTAAINGHNMYNIKTTAVLSFVGTDMRWRQVITRLSDQEMLCTVGYAVQNLKDWRQRVRVGIELDAPTLWGGAAINTGLAYDFEPENFLLEVRGILKAGWIFEGLKGIDIALRNKRFMLLSANASIYGVTPNKPIEIDALLERDGKGFAQSAIFVRNHLEDEVKFQLSKNSETPLSGDVAIFSTMQPGRPSIDFSGFLYKTQVSWIFTETEFKVAQHGECNVNRASPPGMPFRYGIKYTSTLPGQGEVHVFGEDTNMGKTIGFEMTEMLLFYQLQKENSMVWGVDSNVLLNWRKYLGRGVVSSQGEWSLAVDKSMQDGKASLSWTLPDEIQSVLDFEVDFVYKDKMMTVNSKSSLTESTVHTAAMTMEFDKDILIIKLDGSLPSVFIEGRFDGEFSSSPAPSVKFNFRVHQNATDIWLWQVVAAPEERPKFVYYFAPGSNCNTSMRLVDLRLESPVKPGEMSAANFALTGHLKTKPIFADTDFSLRLKDSVVVDGTTRRGVQFIEAEIEMVDDRRNSHKAECNWRYSRKDPQLPFSFALDLSVESGNLPTGSLDISLEHVYEDHDSLDEGDSESGYDEAVNYTFACKRNSSCDLNINSLEEEDGFKSAMASINRHGKTKESFVLDVDKKSALRIFIDHDGESHGEVSMEVDLNSQRIFSVRGEGDLKRADDSGFALGLKSSIVVAPNSDTAGTASFGLELSDVPTNTAIELSVLSDIHSLGRHTFKLEADLAYLTQMVSTGEFDTRNTKTYHIQVEDNVVRVEFSNVSNVMLTCNLPTLAVPLVFRLGYLKGADDKDGEVRTLMEINEPVLLDLRTQIYNTLEDGKSAYVALSNEKRIAYTIDSTSLTDLLQQKSDFLAFGCSSSYGNCTNLMIGCKMTKSGRKNLQFNVVLPRKSETKVDVYSVGAEISTSFPSLEPWRVKFSSPNREADFGIWYVFVANQTKHKLVTDIAWNRRQNGTLKFIYDESSIKIEGPTILMDAGVEFKRPEGPTYFLRTTDFADGRTNTYMELTVNKKNEVEIRSDLFKAVVSSAYERRGNLQTWSLYQGAFGSRSKTLAEISLQREKIDVYSEKLHLRVMRNGRWIDANSTIVYSPSKQAIYSEIDLDGNTGELVFERVPGKLIYFNCNNNSIFEMKGEIQPNAVIGNVYLQYKDGALRMDCAFRASSDPMLMFFKVNTARAELMMQAQASNLLEFNGTIKHSFRGYSVTTDSQVSAHLNRETSRYHLDAFWRLRALLDLVVSGLDSISESGLVAFKAELEENLLSLVTEELAEVAELFERKALAEAWSKHSKRFANLFSSLDIPQLRNTSLSDNVKEVHQKIIMLLDVLGDALCKIDITSIYDVSMIASKLRQMERIARKSVAFAWSTADNAVDAIRTISGEFIEIFFSDPPPCLEEAVLHNLRQLKKVFVTFFSSVGDALTALEKDVREVRRFREFLPSYNDTEAYLQAQLASCVPIIDGMLGPDFEMKLPQPTQFFRTNESEFWADWTTMSLRSSFFVPKLVENVAGVLSAYLTGYPLNKDSTIERSVVAMAPILKDFPVIRETISFIDKRIFRAYNYDAWFFLETAGKSSVMTFGKRIKSFDIPQGSVVLLAFDSINHQTEIWAEFLDNEAWFTYHIGQNTLSISECGVVANNGTGRKQSHFERIGESNVTITRSAYFWQMEDDDRAVLLTFHTRERILHLRVGDRWHGRLRGVLGMPGNYAVEKAEGREFLKLWSSPLGSGSKWSTYLLGSCTKDKSLLRSTVGELFEQFKGQSEECPVEVFMELAHSSNPQCNGPKCKYSKNSVYNAHKAMASCIGHGFIKNPCFGPRPPKHIHRKRTFLFSPTPPKQSYHL